jgi:Uma2 family endonuclease
MVMPSLSHGDWTVERLHALPDDGNRYEIIDGALHVTPAPFPVHQRALSRLIGLLWPYVGEIGLEPMTSPADIQFSSQTLVQPDVFVFPPTISAPFMRWSDIPSLVLVVEILSRSTRHADRTVKRDLYQKQRIPEYWIIDTDLRVFERWRPGQRHPEVLQHELVWQPVPDCPPLVIDVPSYFHHVFDR